MYSIYLTIHATNIQQIVNMNWESFGDPVLVRVTGAIEYGRSQPSRLSFPPLDGYNEHSVASAVGLVWLPYLLLSNSYFLRFALLWKSGLMENFSNATCHRF
jgi:hypothetical protein